VFEHFGVELQKRVEAQVIDEIGSSTLMRCGFDLVQMRIPAPERGCKHPLLFPAVLQVILLLKYFSRSNSVHRLSSLL